MLADAFCTSQAAENLLGLLKFPLKSCALRCGGPQRRLATVQAVTLDVEDLEQDATPEDLMLSFVSSERGKVPPPPLGAAARAGRLCFQDASWLLVAFISPH